MQPPGAGADQLLDMSQECNHIVPGTLFVFQDAPRIKLTLGFCAHLRRCPGRHDGSLFHGLTGGQLTASQVS